MTEMEKELKQLRQTCLQLAQENAQLTELANDAMHGRTTLTNTDAVFGGTVMLKNGGASDEVAELKQTLERQTVQTARLLEQVAQLVALVKVQSEKIAKFEADEMGDELNAAEAEQHAAAEYRTMALFVDGVRVMRVMQNQYFATRDKSVLVMAKQFEAKVDKTIANDIFFIELLKKL